MALLDTGSGSIYYEANAGASGRPTVLLSHGWGMSCRAWDDTVARLQDAGYGTVAYDHRNCGHSSKDFAAVGVDALAADVVALVDTLALDRVVLNGWSLGGAVVVGAAAQLGARLAGLVSTGGATPRYTQAAGFPHGGTADDVAATVAALRAGRIDFIHGLYTEGVFVAPVSDAVKAHAVSLALQASPGADASLAALADLDQRDIMASLAVPALVVFGANDGVVDPATGQFAADLLPQGELLMLDNCGHAPFLEQSEAYHARLLEFLAGL